MNTPYAIITITIAALIASCGTTPIKPVDEQIDQILKQKKSPIVFSAEKTPTIVSVKKAVDIKLEQIVNVLIKKPIDIRAAIDAADSSLSVSIDKGVDLSQKFGVKFTNQTLSKYFVYLENITGYSIKLDDGVVYVRSVQLKTWHLQTLSQNIESLSSSDQAGIKQVGTGAPELVPNTSNSNWEQIIAHIRTIMGEGAVVAGNQQLGTISAIGLPKQVSQADRWIQDLIASSNRQIHLQVQVLDVTVDSAVGQGINWNLISNQSSKFQIGNNSQQAIDGTGLISIGSVKGSAIDLGKKITLDVMLNLLSKQGKVKVDSQPNITVTNGRRAYISTGDEFSYIKEIKAVPDDNGNVITTSEIDRIGVGIDMRVTPKILPDNRIVVSIVPVISSLKSFTTLSSGSGSSLQEFQTPNIALQKLATQVIVESGKTIHLGGLIASKISNSAKGTPSGGILNTLFSGSQKSLERREVVVLITPTIVQ